MTMQSVKREESVGKRVFASPVAIIVCALALVLAAVMLCSCSSSSSSSASGSNTSSTSSASSESSTAAAGSSASASSSSTSEAKNAIVARARECLGIPYVWGGCSQDGVDASGLVSYCCTGKWARIGTTETFMNWPRVANPQPGDICASQTFCGIYIGDNTMIAASYSRSVVREMVVLDDMIFVEYAG